MVIGKWVCLALASYFEDVGTIPIYYIESWSDWHMDKLQRFDKLHQFGFYKLHYIYTYLFTQNTLQVYTCMIKGDNAK